MAITAAALVLFVTFHCLMNSVAILWPTAYNAVCEFLGANWYALIASAGLALLVFIHIVYAFWLTMQNRAARGSVRYSIEARPKSVEWASKNMLVLGIVVFCFLIVHLINFWAKMQLVEVMGWHGTLPPAAGTLFLQEAFSCWWVPVIYAIGFIALWFHLNHGFWSMFQSIGWDNTRWIPRLKCIGKIWVAVVMVLFFIQLGVFTWRSSTGYYKTNPELREQYKEMIVAHVTPQLGDFSAMFEQQYANANYEQLSAGVRQMYEGVSSQLKSFETPEGKEQLKMILANDPTAQDQLNAMKNDVLPALAGAVETLDFLEEGDPKPEPMPGVPAGAQPVNR